MQDRRSAQPHTATKFRTQHLVALSFLFVAIAATSIIGVESWSHWREASLSGIPMPPPIPSLRDREALIEKALTQNAISKAELDKSILELRRRIADQKLVLPELGLEPLPPGIIVTTFPIPVFKSSEWDGALHTYAYYYGLYLKQHWEWKTKKAIVDEVNAQLDSMEHELNKNVQEFSTLANKETFLSSNLRDLRDDISKAITFDAASDTGVSVWNNWIAPLWHLSLMWLLSAITINLGIRFILLRGWIGVGKI